MRQALIAVLPFAHSLVVVRVLFAFLPFAYATTPFTVTTRRYELACGPGFQTEADNKYVAEAVAIDPHATALVLIDVWDDSKSKPLSDNEHKRLLPLLAAARVLGMLIVHAPSELLEWPEIKVLPGEILVTGTSGLPGSSSRCDAVILNSTRRIKHVLMAGYDTNKCITDKPCGAVSLSSELAGHASLLIVRDATRGEFGWYGNAWYGLAAHTTMLEMGTWLTTNNSNPTATSIAATSAASSAAATCTAASSSTPSHAIRSLLLADLLRAAGAPSNASALLPTGYPRPSAVSLHRRTAQLPALPPVLASSTSIRALAALPPSPSASAALVVVSCSSDYSNEGFLARVNENRAGALEPLLAAWRSSKRPVIHVLNGHQPAATLPQSPSCAPLAGELSADSNDEFDKLLKANSIDMLFYVGYAANTDMMFGVGGQQRWYSRSRFLGEHVPSYYWVAECTIGMENRQTLGDRWGYKAALAYRQPLRRAGGRPYSSNIVGASDLIKALGAKPVALAAEEDAEEEERTAGAIVGAAEEEAAEEEAAEQNEARLGNDREYAQPVTATSLFPHSLLPPSEISALVDLYKQCGGAQWRYERGTDAVGRGKPWPIPGNIGPDQSLATSALESGGGDASSSTESDANAFDPCGQGWFGVKCNSNRTHIVELFPNPRHSGNPLVGCALPASIGNLTRLEHLYTSNDATPSALHGSIPSELGSLAHLKCLYLSHNQLSGEMPTQLQRLTNLQVFLMRKNQLSGGLIDFTPLTKLRNVWFDTNANLTGNLSSLASLPMLTFLQASHNGGLAGDLPAPLCGIKCEAQATSVRCDEALPKRCCGIPACGAAPTAPKPPPSTMGECNPQ